MRDRTPLRRFVYFVRNPPIKTVCFFKGIAFAAIFALMFYTALHSADNPTEISEEAFTLGMSLIIAILGVFLVVFTLLYDKMENKKDFSAVAGTILKFSCFSILVGFYGLFKNYALDYASGLSYLFISLLFGVFIFPALLSLITLIKMVREEWKEKGVGPTVSKTETVNLLDSEGVKNSND